MDKSVNLESVSDGYQKPEGSARQIFPGSNSNQARPSLIKRDSDVAPPHYNDMGGISYCYAPPRNKKPCNGEKY
jgi:hypothetical protein